MSDIDDDFPLADHPEYTGPKAGDPDMNRARDIKHYDVAGAGYRVKQVEEGTPKRVMQAAPADAYAGIPEDAPVRVAWKRLCDLASPPEHPFHAFLAGWTARDSQP